MGLGIDNRVIVVLDVRVDYFAIARHHQDALGCSRPGVYRNQSQPDYFGWAAGNLPKGVDRHPSRPGGGLWGNGHQLARAAAPGLAQQQVEAAALVESRRHGSVGAPGVGGKALGTEPRRFIGWVVVLLRRG